MGTSLVGHRIFGGTVRSLIFAGVLGGSFSDTQCSGVFSLRHCEWCFICETVSVFGLFALSRPHLCQGRLDILTKSCTIAVMCADEKVSLGHILECYSMAKVCIYLQEKPRLGGAVILQAVNKKACHTCCAPYHNTERVIPTRNSV